MDALILPFLVGDVILAAMWWRVWRTRPSYSASVAERRVHQFLLLRLSLALALSLTGTLAIARS